MAEDDDTGASTEAPAEAWGRLNELIRQAFEDQDNPFRAPAPPPAPADLVPLVQLVNLGTDPNGATLALWCEERIRSGQIIAQGIKPTLDLLNEAPGHYHPVPREAWAGLVIDWWFGSASPAEHHGPAAAASPAWKYLHVARSDVLEPDPHTSGDDLLLTLGTACLLAILWRWQETVPADWPWRPGAFFHDRPDLLPHPTEVVAMLHGAVRDGELRTYTREGKLMPISAWQASSERADLGAGALNLGLSLAEAAYARPAQRPRWIVALVRLGDLRRWHKIGLEQVFPAPARVEECRIGLAASTPPIKTKKTLPVDELRAELQRMGDTGELTTSWNKDAGQLYAWRLKTHPEKPGAKSTIYADPILQAEHAKLAPRS